MSLRTSVAIASIYLLEFSKVKLNYRSYHSLHALENYFDHSKTVWIIARGIQFLASQYQIRKNSIMVQKDRFSNCTVGSKLSAMDAHDLAVHVSNILAPFLSVHALINCVCCRLGGDELGV